MLKKILTVGFATLLSLQVLAQESQKQTHMPDWTLETENGGKVEAAEYAGKPLILHFWATWCPYCKKLQPGLDKIASKYKEQGLEVLGVSLLEKPGAKPQTELQDRGVNLKTVIKGEALAESFQVYGTPTTVFIAPDGRILGSTMDSEPDDPRWEQVAKALVNLPREQESD